MAKNKFVRVSAILAIIATAFLVTKKNTASSVSTASCAEDKKKEDVPKVKED